MKTLMNIDELTQIEDLETFLQGNQQIAYAIPGDKTQRYQLVQKLLIKFSYLSCSKKDKGIINRFLIKLTGYSRQQLSRLINRYRKKGYIRHCPARSNGFHQKYQKQDIRLLAEVDELHDTPCGHAVKKLFERSYHIFGDEHYRTLASISVSHLYNLRASKTYCLQRRDFEKTKSKHSTIGEKRKPQPNCQPGFLRIDTVHQGDQDKQKGVYHINAVDEVTQFEIVLSVEKISERFLIPVLEQILEAFPFNIQGFHSDNGSEYINKAVEKLLNKLLIEFTKSRARQTNDNALVEGKNAAVVRKIFGYTHIPQKWAPSLNEFNINYLFPYINYHRPCFFPEIITDNKGKQRKKYLYDNMMTPYEKLKSLPESTKYLKPGISFEILDQAAMEMTDNQAAKILKQKRQKLFNQIFEQKKMA